MFSLVSSADIKSSATLHADQFFALTLTSRLPSVSRASSLLFTGLFRAGAQNVLGTVVGALIFPDFRFHPLNVLGLALGMAGAVWYATEAALKVPNPCTLTPSAVNECCNVDCTPSPFVVTRCSRSAAQQSAA